MTINFENYGRFYATLIFEDSLLSYRNENTPHSLKECADFIEYKMEQNPEVVSGIICDFDTGEVVADIKREEDEEPDLDWGYNEDMGFDPYMGCYTDDV